jgi:hypothetical protein
MGIIGRVGATGVPPPSSTWVSVGSRELSEAGRALRAERDGPRQRSRGSTGNEQGWRSGRSRGGVSDKQGQSKVGASNSS